MEKKEERTTCKKAAVAHEEKVIYKPHVAYAFFWLSLAIWLSVLIFFGFDYKKTRDQVDIDLKKIELSIMEKKVELEKVRSLSKIKVVDEKGE